MEFRITRQDKIEETLKMVEDYNSQIKRLEEKRNQILDALVKEYGKEAVDSVWFRR